METKQKESTYSKEANLKSFGKTLSSESDSSVNFDSAADCSYKSGEISLTHISSSEQLSNFSLTDSDFQPSKTDQNLRFDSGLEADCISSPLSESGYFLSEESSKPLQSLTAAENKKLQWQDIFVQDKDGDT